MEQHFNFKGRRLLLLTLASCTNRHSLHVQPSPIGSTFPLIRVTAHVYLKRTIAYFMHREITKAYLCTKWTHPPRSPFLATETLFVRAGNSARFRVQ